MQCQTHIIFTTKLWHSLLFISIYTDNMINMNLITQQLQQLALNEGAAKIGFATVERFDEIPRKCGPRPCDVYPKARSVISVAVQMPDACMERAAFHDYDDPEAGLVNVLVSLRLNRIAARLARHLEISGFTAFPVAATVIWRFRPYKEFDAPFLSDLSHRHMAVGCGLGEFGWNGLLMTPEYGPRVRLVSVITDALLTSTPIYNGEPLCDKCMRCVQACGRNIKGLTEGTKGKVSIRIGGKVCEYANKNLWYCAWTENLSIRHDMPKPGVWDEEHICARIKEIVDEHPDWYESWTVEPCWGECLPRWLRTFEPGYSKVPRRKKEVVLTGNKPDITRIVKVKSTELTKNIFKRASIQFIDIGSDTELAKRYRYFMPDMNSIIAVRIPMEAYQGIGTSLWYRVLDLELALITWLDNMGYGAIQLSFIRNRTQDQDVITRLFEKNHVTDYIDKKAIDNRLVEAVLTTTNFIEGDTCRIALIGTNLELEPGRFEVEHEFHPELKSNLSDLKEELRGISKKAGADLFGVCDKARYDSITEQLQVYYRDSYRLDAEDLNPGKGPYVPRVTQRKINVTTMEERLPGARSVIVLGIQMSDGIVNTRHDNTAEVIGPYVTHKSYLRDILCGYAYTLCEYLHSHGYRAAPFIDVHGIESVTTYPIREYREDLFASRFAAVAAGLGELGHHGMLLTPQFGVRQMLLSVITDAPLTSDALYNGPTLCLDCRQCVCACPVTAISNDINMELNLEGKIFRCGKLSINHCDWSKKYCLAGDEGPVYTGATHNILPPAIITAENLAAALKQTDPLQKDYFLAMEPCFIYCPAGGKGNGKR